MWKIFETYIIICSFLCFVCLFGFFVHLPFFSLFVVVYFSQVLGAQLFSPSAILLIVFFLCDFALICPVLVCLIVCTVQLDQTANEWMRKKLVRRKERAIATEVIWTDTRIRLRWRKGSAFLPLTMKIWFKVMQILSNFHAYQGRHFSSRRN